MQPLELSARALVDAALDLQVEDLRPPCRGVLAAADQSPWDELHGAVTVLARGLSSPNLIRAGAVGIVCGALVERGAHPEIAFESLPFLPARFENPDPRALQLLHPSTKLGP